MRRLTTARVRYLPLVIAALCAADSALAFPWSKDMANQDSVKAQESVVRAPPGAISRNGRPPALPVAPMIEARKLAAAQLQSPLPPVFSSLNEGQRLYQRHCSTCHGIDGKQPGRVGLKLQPKPMDLTLDYVRQQPDGQLYYTISQGSSVMPAYWFTMTAAERWALVNYVRHGLGR